MNQPRQAGRAPDGRPVDALSRPRALWPLLTSMAFLSIGGFVGGSSFVADRTGAGIGASLTWLDHTPVPDFLLPGLFLLVVFAIGTLLMMVGLAWRFSPRLVRPVDRWIGFRWSWAGTIAIGSVLVVWILYEFTIFPDRIVLQPVLLAIGTLMTAIPCLPSMRNYCRTRGGGRL